MYLLNSKNTLQLCKMSMYICSVLYLYFRAVLECDGHVFILIHRDVLDHAAPHPGIKFRDRLSILFEGVNENAQFFIMSLLFLEDFYYSIVS